MKTKYYEVMERYLSDANGDERVKREIRSIINYCQEYNWYYTVYKKLDTVYEEGKHSRVRDVLQNYMYEDNYIAKRKRSENASRKNELEIEEKLYFEFFTKIYKMYYKNADKKDILIMSENKINTVLNDYFQGKDTSLRNRIQKSANKLFTYDYKKLKIENLHIAMGVLGEALRTPMPDMKGSVEAVLSESFLENLAYWIENEPPISIFWIAPARRALKCGAYHKYTPAPKRRTVYFDLKCEYNLDQLKIYITGGQDKEGYCLGGLKDIYERYSETYQEIEGLKK